MAYTPNPFRVPLVERGDAEDVKRYNREQSRAERAYWVSRLCPSLVCPVCTRVLQGDVHGGCKSLSDVWRVKDALIKDGCDPADVEAANVVSDLCICCRQCLRRRFPKVAERRRARLAAEREKEVAAAQKEYDEAAAFGSVRETKTRERRRYRAASRLKLQKLRENEVAETAVSAEVSAPSIEAPGVEKRQHAAEKETVREDELRVIAQREIDEDRRRRERERLRVRAAMRPERF